MKPALATIALTVTALLTASAGELRCTSTATVTVCIISDTEIVAPGKPFLVGLLLRLQPCWATHTATPNGVGDSKFSPTSITWQLPKGFTAIPLGFPPASRTSSIGEGTGNVWHWDVWDNEVLLITEITPPQKIHEKVIPIRAKAKLFLECDDRGIGDARHDYKMSIKLKRGKEPRTVNEELFAKHRALIQK